MSRRVVLYSRLGFLAVLGTSLAVIIGIRPTTPVVLAEPAPAKPSRPMPVNTETNCVRCHLTAGRELTEAVHTFAHSVHDRVADVSCHDCHGGNLEDDAKAHESKFGFIGTKMSAHLAKCQECHQEQYESLSSGPHAWDHQKRLSITHPLCVDCHGNHDIGNPPLEFSLSVVCSECHRGYEEKFPAFAKLTDAEDEMWAAIVHWQEAHPDASTRVPEDLEDDLAGIRTAAAQWVHASKPIDVKTVESVVAQMKDLAEKIGQQKTAQAPAPQKR